MIHSESGFGTRISHFSGPNKNENRMKNSWGMKKIAQKKNEQNEEQQTNYTSIQNITYDTYISLVQNAS